MELRYNGYFSIALGFIAIMIFVLVTFAPNIGIQSILEFPVDFNAIMQNPLQIFNCFLYPFNYVDKDIKVLLLDVFILLTVSWGIERRMPLFLMVVVLVSVLLNDIIKLFIFNNADIDGLRPIILTYLFSSFFIAFKDGFFNINALFILVIYYTLGYYSGNMNFYEFDNYVTSISAILASILVIPVANFRYKKIDTSGNISSNL